MKQANEKKLNIGNLNSVPDLQVLQQIKSVYEKQYTKQQYTKKDNLHQDFDIFLDMLTEQLDDKWIGEHIKGFIQLNCKKPFLLVFQNFQKNLYFRL